MTALDLTTQVPATSTNEATEIDPAATSFGNLYFTMVLRASNVQQMAKYNLAATLSVARAAAEQGAQTRVKWPNGIAVFSFCNSCFRIANVGDVDERNQKLTPPQEADTS